MDTRERKMRERWREEEGKIKWKTKIKRHRMMAYISHGPNVIKYTLRASFDLIDMLYLISLLE